MAELKRYRCVTVSTTSGRQPPWGEMQRCPDGQWMRYEDVEQLQRDLDAAYAALWDVIGDLGDSLDWMEQDHAEALKKARDEG